MGQIPCSTERISCIFIISSASAMLKNQPWDLNQTLPVGRKWCRFTNALTHFGGSPSDLGRQKSHFGPLFFATSALDTSYRRNKTSHRQTKRKCQSTMCPLKVNLLSGIFDQETAEIRWRIVTHHIKVQHFLSLPHFPHKNHWTQANHILIDVT